MGRDQNGLGPKAGSLGQRPVDKGRSTTCGQAHHDIFSPNPPLPNRPCTGSRIVLRAFLGTENRLRPTRQNRLHLLRIGMERRRHFAGVQNPEPPTRSRSHIKEPTPPPQGPCDQLGCPTNLPRRFPERPHILFFLHHKQM